MSLSPLRGGRITGSRIGAVLGVNRYQSRADTMREMVRQALNADSEFDGNEHTRYGQDHEQEALEAYEQLTGNLLHGGQDLVIHPLIPWLAVTPDGLVSYDGMVETKCPTRARYTHISEKPEYEAQIRLQLECTDRDWCDFAIWRDGEPLAVSRVDRDPWWLESVMPTLESFMTEFRAVIADPSLAAPYLAPKIKRGAA